MPGPLSAGSTVDLAAGERAKSERPSRDGPSPWVALALCVMAPLVVGGLSGAATSGAVQTWYPSLIKPAFNPPSWIFGPVWTTLYIAMGVAAFLVWRNGPDRDAVRVALVLFAVHLLANGAWSLLFFGAQNPGLAFAEILVLLAMILVTTRLFWAQSKAAGVLMVPYIAWVSFASLLNYSIWRLNA